MKSSISEPTRNRGGSYLSFVKQAYRRDYAIPVLEYQTAGIISRSLWTSKDHIIRIIPGLDASGKVLRQNTNINDYSTDAPYSDYLSGTFMMATTVNNFGETGQTFITDYAPGSEDESKFAGDTLIHCFIRNIWGAVNAKGKSKFGVTNEWRVWAGRKGSIKFDKPSLLMQALIFKTNGRDNADKEGVPMLDADGEVLPLLAIVAIDHTKSIGALMQALVEPSNPGLPLDALTNNKYGGMAELDGNLMFLNSVDDPEGKYKMLRPSVQAPGKGWTPTPFPLSEDVVQSLWHPWEEVIHYLTADEQALLLAAEYGADTVNYVIGTDPKFSTYALPEEIAVKGLGRYAQFCDGHTKLTGAITAGTPALPKAKGLSLAPSATAAATEEAVPTAPKLGGLRGIPKSSGIDTDKIKAEVAKLRKAAAITAEEDDSQANAAAALLDDEDLADDLADTYDGMEEEYEEEYEEETEE